MFSLVEEMRAAKINSPVVSLIEEYGRLEKEADEFLTDPNRSTAESAIAQSKALRACLELCKFFPMGSDAPL